MTSIEKTVFDIVEFLKADKVLSAVPGIEFHIEDKSDIVSEIEKFLKGFGIMVVISVTGFDRRANSGNSLTGTLRLNISAVENTKHNRIIQGFATATDVSVRIAEIMHFAAFECLTSPVRFSGMQRADTDRENCIMNANYIAEAVLFTADESTETDNETTQEGE